MNYPALAGGASCFIEPALTGLTRSPQALIILFGQFLPYSRLRIPVAWFSQRRCLLLGEVRRKIYRLETYYGKGGGAPVPALKGGSSRYAPFTPER